MTKDQRDMAQLVVSVAFFAVWSAYCGWVVLQSMRDRHESALFRARLAGRMEARDGATIGFTWNNTEGEGRGHDRKHRVPALEPRAEPG